MEDNALYWFPLRIRNSSLDIQEGLRRRLEQEAEVIETYVPKSFRKVSDTKMDFAPTLVNFIFVYATSAGMKAIKDQREKYERLRYLMHTAYDEKFDTFTEIVRIDDRRMRDFMRVVEHANEQVIFLNNPNFAFRPGHKVQITEGTFAGVKGIVKTIKKSLCVIIPLVEEVGAIAITHVHRKHLRFLPE